MLVEKQSAIQPIYYNYIKTSSTTTVKYVYQVTPHPETQSQYTVKE